MQEQKIKPWQRLLFSETLAKKNKSHQIAYIAVMTALSIVVNFVEIKFMDNQFSFTILTALLIGIILGALPGFGVCLLGDFIGFLLNPGYMYMPWIGISTGMFAFLSGMIINGISWKFKSALFVKLFIVCLVSFLVCTIGINTTGFYFYYKTIGFTTAFLDYVAQWLGVEASYWLYCAYRLFFKGQIWNSLFNYALLFIAVPALEKLKLR